MDDCFPNSQRVLVQMEEMSQLEREQQIDKQYIFIIVLLGYVLVCSIRRAGSCDCVGGGGGGRCGRRL